VAEALDEAVALLAQLARAATTRALYPADHPQSRTASAELVSALERCLRRRGEDEITFLTVDQDVILDERPLRTKSMYLRPFAKLMGRLGVQRVTLARGLSASEAEVLASAFAGIASFDGIAHVAVGRVAVALGDDGAESGSGSGGSARGGRLDDGDYDSGKGAFAGLAGSGAGIAQLDQLVWRVVEAVASTSRSMLLLAPVRDFDEELFQHSLNTAMIAVALARALGIDGDPLHAIGFGALLHDVGKLALPRQIWSQEGALDGGSWEVARLHPELGAALLAGVDGVPPLAVLVAYEHHLRWDRQPSYPATSRQPGLASQITAVADSWDVMVEQASPGSTTRAAAIAAWSTRAGTYLDPFLVGQLVTWMRDDEPAAPLAPSSAR